MMETDVRVLWVATEAPSQNHMGVILGGTVLVAGEVLPRSLDPPSCWWTVREDAGLCQALWVVGYTLELIAHILGSEPHRTHSSFHS